jgi:hypothetical protein
MMDLRRRVEKYLRQSGRTATSFGREVLGDPCFVFDLRKGRQLRPPTANRVSAWLDRHDL